MKGMFGVYRFALALLVMIGHLWPQLASKSGTYAVFSFYMLSGYLMTFVLREVYGMDRKGIVRFLFNRFLRIYPLYWVVAVMTLFLLLSGISWEGYRDSAIVVPKDFVHWIVNVLVFGLAKGVVDFHMSGQRLVSAAWSLHVELCFYLMMAFVLSRKDCVVVVWIVVSLIYTAWMVVHGYSWQERYFPLAAASLPFSLGAGCYLLVRRGIKVPVFFCVVAPVVFLAHAISSSFVYGEAALPMGKGFYISLCMSLFVIISLSTIDAREKFVSAIDKMIGSLSYPIFLLHQIVGMVVSAAYGIGPGRRLFWVTLLFSVTVSLILNILVESQVEKLRSIIRGGVIR